MATIGTSGWTYDDWKGVFYPQHLARRRWLEYYCETFGGVEVNSSFYHIPRKSVAEGWLERTPPGFRFVFKMPRGVTHDRRLEECGDLLSALFTSLSPLAGKIAGFLIQLPPDFQPELSRLSTFLEGLPKRYRYFIETRLRAGAGGEVLDYEKLAAVLSAHEVGFCIHDYPGRSPPDLVTSDAVYLRFHGYRRLYAGSYPEEALAGWAKRIVEWEREGKEVFVFFNNDVGGAGVGDALRLRKLLEALLPR